MINIYTYRGKWAFTFIVFILLFSLSIQQLHAAELHVGEGQPYKTIQSAINASSDGDTITIHEGIYFESVMTPKSGISASQHYVIQGAAGELIPVIDVQGTYDQLKQAFDVSDVSHVTIKNIEIRNAGLRAITIANERSTSDVVVDGVRILDTNPDSPNDQASGCCNPAGIFIGYHGEADGVVVKNSYFKNPYAAGVKIDSRNGHGVRVKVKNNFFDQDHTGIHVKWAETSVDRELVIEGNYFYDIPQYAILNEQSYTLIYNNIINASNVESVVYIGENKQATATQIVHNSFIGVTLRFRNGINTLVKDNILYQGKMNDYTTGGNAIANNYNADNFFADPWFVDPESGDFSLKAGSPAIAGASDGEDYGAFPESVGIITDADSSPAILPANFLLLLP